MTHDRDLDRLLSAWLADGPWEPADRVIDEVAERIHRQGQEPAWRLALRETPPMTYLKPLAAIAAVTVLALAGLSLVWRPSGVAAPGPTPTPVATTTPTPTPTPSPEASPSPVAITCDDGTATSCTGPIGAGAFTSTSFEPGFTLTVPDGWENSLDIARTVNLHPTPHTFDVQVLSQLAIPEQNAGCTAEKKAGAGNTVQDWIDFIENHPGLITKAPVPVTVGGYEGQRIQFRVADDWTERCPDSIGPAVMVFTDSGDPPARARWFDDHRVTVWFVDVNGTTVAIHVDSGPSFEMNDTDVAAFQPILDTIRFATGG